MATQLFGIVTLSFLAPKKLRMLLHVSFQIRNEVPRPPIKRVYKSFVQ